MIDFYIGYIGVNPNDFWTNTFKENKLLSEAYVNEKNVIWEQTRYLATMLHNVQCSKKSQMIKPQNLFELPQDNLKKENLNPSTKEEFEKFKKLVDNKLNKK